MTTMASTLHSSTSVSFMIFPTEIGLDTTMETNTFNINIGFENHTSVATTGADDGLDDMSPGAIITAEIVAILCAVFGFGGNALTFVTILITPRLKQNANNVFVCNLSVADALYCGVILPWQAAIYNAREWIWNETFCVWLAVLTHTFFGASLMSLCAIALNRYIHVCYPNYRTRVYTRPKIVAMLVVCWVFPLVLNLTPVFGLWGEYGFRQRGLICTFGKDENPNTDSHRIFLFGAALLIPIVFMTFCYARIGVVFYKSRKKLRHWSRSEGRELPNSGRQLTISMLVIFVAFVLGVGPADILGIVDHKMDCRECHLLIPMLSSLQITLNPVIYTITNSQFQDAYKSIFRRIVSCLQTACCRPCKDCQKCSPCGGLSCFLTDSTSVSTSSQVITTQSETSA